ncbi:MAG: hypothetical protein L3K26_14340 [Candidatus Hydrogenedentes bacterium]|nr:hypothetical protein [Candidatus Hydrogenedentota bacterium]
MGHYCRICGRSRPNEKFSGKGHRNHVCKKCQQRPKAEREAIEQQDEIFGYLKQSNISDRNMKRLQELAESENPRTGRLAQIARDVAIVKSHKRRRLKVLAEKRPDLLAALEETGLILAQGGGVDF